MPNTNLDVLATTHARYVKGPVTDGVTDSSPFYFLLKKKGTIKYSQHGTQYGPGVLRNLRHDIKKWGGTDVKSIPIPRLFTNWAFDWCGYMSQWATIEWDMLENKGEEAIADLYQETADALLDDWANFVNGLLFADGSSESPPGLLGLPAFMKATGTYGGLAQTAAPWQPYVLHGTTGIVGKTFESHPYAYMRQATTTLATRGLNPQSGRPSNRPDFCITDLSAYNHIVNYHTTAFGQAPMAVNEETFGMGWRNFVFEGIDVYYDSACTDQTMYFLTMKDMEWVFQTKSMFATATHKIPQPIGSEAHQTWTKCALVCRSPRRQAIITNLGV